MDISMKTATEEGLLYVQQYTCTAVKMTEISRRLLLANFKEYVLLTARTITQD
jgi:hypothetical protein